MTRRRYTPLLLTLSVALCGLVFYTPIAAASWAFGHCGKGEERHCYAVTRWDPSASEDIFNTGSEINTTQMYEPSPASEKNFIDNEQWLGWGAERYIEAGQSAGYPRTSRTKIFPFYAITDKTEYEEYTSHEEVAKNTSNLYQFYVPKESESTVGEDWCIKWLGVRYPKSHEHERCFTHLFGAATELEAGVEVATAAEPLNNGISEGFAVGGKEELWQSETNSENHATLEHEEFKKEGKTDEATCAGPHAPGYGSLEFGAGEGCPLTNGGDIIIRQSGGEPLGCVPPPSEALISLSTVERIVAKEAELDNDAQPSAAFVARGSLDSALEVMRPGSMTTVKADAGAAKSRCLTEPVYLVELAGSFTLHDAKVRRGASAPVGTVLRLVLDAHTGEIEARYLGGTPAAALESLGAVRELG